MLRTRTAWLAKAVGLVTLAVALPPRAGAEETKLIPVSGIITLDGKPLVKVYVQFTPQVAGAPSSRGRTDDDGKFTLRVADKRAGAVPGKHRVWISTVGYPPKEGEKKGPGLEQIPPRYNARTSLLFEIPADTKGTLQANIDLRSR